MSEFLDRWAKSRARTLTLVSTIPEAALSFSPLPGYRTMQELIVHIVGTEITVLEGITTGSFEWGATTSRLADRSVPELTEIARATDARLKLLLESAVDLEERIEPFSRSEWLWLVYDHEIHHCGVLALMMRLAGLEVSAIFS